MFFAAALLLIIVGQANAGETNGQLNKNFTARCKNPSTVTCLALDSDEEISRLRFSPPQLSATNRVQLDPIAKAARFTIPTHSAADSSGQLHIPFPQPMVDVYVSFDVRYPAELIGYPFKGGGGQKIFILGQGKEGCAPFEIVGNIPKNRPHPSFYYICGAAGSNVAIQNPLGDNTSQFDYQPGGDTACLRTPDQRAKPCAYLEPNEWVTYQVHVNALAAFLEVWQTVRGKTLKIIEFSLGKFPSPPPKYEWIKLTPYNTGKDATEDHPSFSLWYRRVIVSTRKIPFPEAE